MERINTSGRNSIEIVGTIRGIDDVARIKEAIDAFRLEEGENLNISIKDSFSMPSALIGYLLQLVEQQKIQLSLTVDDEMLAELLEDLNLKKVFNLHCKTEPLPA